MKSRFSLKSKLTFLLLIIILPAVGVISWLFYSSFEDAINERIVLHLTSIRKLKSVQIERYLKQKYAFAQLHMTSHREEIPQGDTLIFMDKSERKLQEWDEFRKGLLILGRKEVQDTVIIYASELPEVHEILIERTGMGRTGETYLVGPDSLIRSESRFFRNQEVDTIHVHTPGVQKAFHGEIGYDIFPDYRGIPVYSSYGPLKVGRKNWALLSEIDVREGQLALRNLRYRLWVIVTFTVIILFILSFVASAQFLQPLLRLRNQLLRMSKGDYARHASYSGRSKEISEMYEALYASMDSLRAAIKFANELSGDKLRTNFKPLSAEDGLGHALLAMHYRLKDYKEKQEKNFLENEKALLQGEEKERKRLSRELTEDILPLILQLLELINTDRKEEMLKLVKKIAKEIKYINFNLVPNIPPEGKLEDALREYIAEFARKTNMEISLHSGLNENFRLEPEQQTGLFRIVQEILLNSSIHGDSSQVQLSLTEFEDKIRFTAKDNGTGFNVKEEKSGIGLKTMEERTAVLGGKFRLYSGDDGTTVEIEIPKIRSIE